jgi:hypothetical protein
VSDTGCLIQVKVVFLIQVEVSGRVLLVDFFSNLFGLNKQ